MSTLSKTRTLALLAAVASSAAATAQTVSSTPESRAAKVADAVASRPDAVLIAANASANPKFTAEFGAHNTNPAGVKKLVQDSTNFFNEFARLSNRGGLGITEHEAQAFADHAKKIGEDKAALMAAGGLNYSSLHTLDAPTVRDAPIVSALAQIFTGLKNDGIFALASAANSDQVNDLSKAAISHRIAAHRAEAGLSARPASDTFGQNVEPLATQEVALEQKLYNAAMVVMTAGLNKVGPVTHLSITQGATFEASSPELRTLGNIRNELIAVSADKNQIIATGKVGYAKVDSNGAVQLGQRPQANTAGLVQASFH